MAFDMGFNFRNTAGFVTDQAYAVPVLKELYPNTYTNLNGDSVNAGWDNITVNGIDRNAANDPRLAGVNYATDSMQSRPFRVDLNSGSAPGAGSWSVDIALGDEGDTHTQSSAIDDDTTELIYLTPGGGTVTAPGQFVDATTAVVTASATWTGTPATVMFTSNIARFDMNRDLLNTGFPVAVAHFRLRVPTGGGGGGAGACECSYFHSFEYREVSDFTDCVVGRRS